MIRVTHMLVILVSMICFPSASGADDLERLVPFTLSDIDGQKRVFNSVPNPNSNRIADVFIFILHDCPIANQYQPKIRRLAARFESEAIRFHLIHADPETTLEAARQHAQTYQIEVPVYLDPQHRIVRLLKAEVTPEAIVINSENEKVYQGRIDNLYVKLGRKRFRATQHDLANVLEAIVNGKPIEPTRTMAIGCYIPDLD